MGCHVESARALLAIFILRHQVSGCAAGEPNIVDLGLYFSLHSGSGILGMFWESGHWGRLIGNNYTLQGKHSPSGNRTPKNIMSVKEVWQVFAMMATPEILDCTWNMKVDK